MDHEFCYRATKSRDPRFDGVFFVAVVTTGNYCRPSCPEIVLKKGDLHFYRTVAAAQADGFVACARCMPDAVPGSAEWIRYRLRRSEPEPAARPQSTDIAPWKTRRRWSSSPPTVAAAEDEPMATA